jgi:hypothetical protein
MECCARLNNVGASHLVTGMYVNAIDSFTQSLSLAKSALAVLVSEDQTKNLKKCSSRSLQQQQRCAVVLFKHSTVTVAAPEAKVQPAADIGALRGIYTSPLFLSESATYQRYEPTVEASIAIMFNLALAHHLYALYGPLNLFVFTMEQAVGLYELAYNVQIQEDVELSIEFTMAIINNLGHLYRLLGDEEKGAQCFRHLLSSILFLRSYDGGLTDNNRCHTDTFVHSVLHLILRETAAAAA